MINLWPFDPEEPVELLWIKSPYRDRSKEWMVPLFLRNSGGQTKEFPIPWGLLPNFRLGQHYINGISAETYKTGSITRFDLEDPSSGRLCTIKDLPEGFTVKNYSDIKDECLWMCDVGKTTVYIPCVEVIRSLFAPNAILARAILEPEGLNFVASCKTYVTGMDLIIDQSVPRGLVTEDFILHLAWLHTDPLAKTIWNSILNEIRPSGDVHPDLHLFEGVLNDMEIKPKKIKAKPPLTGKAFMEVRGIQKDYSFLVLEIVAVGNLSLSFKHITYTQNPKVKRRPPDGSRPAVKRIKRKKENQPVSVSDNPSSVSKTTISKNSSNVLLFDKLPE
ncbi:MAG TPA: hypothetical protein VN456_13350, partial [Desulfosporosinus sp.]|nr:hypothetical protein [Desulfosporosinus sp.]